MATCQRNSGGTFFSLFLFLPLPYSLSKTNYENHCFYGFSTKDPGQQPFTFKIGLGSVIKGICESHIAIFFYFIATLLKLK